MNSMLKLDDVDDIYKEWRDHDAISSGYSAAEEQGKNSEAANISKLKVFARIGITSNTIGSNSDDPFPIIDAVELLKFAARVHTMFLRSNERTNFIPNPRMKQC
jgi:hypothetical protein